MVTHVTELDVKCELATGGGSCVYPNWPLDQLQLQADVYNGILKVCLEEPWCRAFEMWGYTDKYTWYEAPRNPLPFDANYLPK